MNSNPRKEKSLEKYIDKSIYSDMGSHISTNNLSNFSIKFEETSDKYSQNDPNKSDEGKTCNDDDNFIYDDYDQTANNFFNKLIMSDQQRSKSVTNSNKLRINNFRKMFENAFKNNDDNSANDYSDNENNDQHFSNKINLSDSSEL